MRLLTPGPTQVPTQVLEAMNRPIIHHRSSEFSELFTGVQQKMNQLLGVSGNTVFFSGSGTAAMEASVNSFFESGDEVVVVVGGKFGQRWQHLAKSYGLNLKTIAVEWGKAVNAAEVISHIGRSTRGVLIQACETSTGVFHPVFDLADELKKIDHVLLVVDGITATGIYDFSMEQQGIDVLIGASQKALMCPPGLAWVSMRQRAVERLKPNPRSLYLSIAKELGQQNEGKTAYTPAISLFWGLAEALSMIFSEGPQEVYRRHTELQSMARSRFSDLGFALYNEADCAARGLTAVCGRPGMDIKVWLKRLKKDYGLWLAGGQDELEGKIFRCAHMGYCYPKDLNEAFAVLEQSLEAK